MSYENLSIERDDLIAVVTLNRPEKLNALNRALHLEMMDACQELRDDDGVRVVIFTGAGRGFCSGADLTGDRATDEHPSRGERLDEYNWVGRQAMMVYRGLDKPTIAAVNGVAAGAGMGLALACDLRVGCENTRFKTVFIERSLSPDSGLSYFLPRIVGISRAFDLVFTSRNVDADEAYRLGLLDRLTTSENLLAEARELARQIAGWPPVAMQMSKRALQRSMDTDLADQLGIRDPQYRICPPSSPRRCGSGSLFPRAAAADFHRGVMAKTLDSPRQGRVPSNGALMTRARHRRIHSGHGAGRRLSFRQHLQTGRARGYVARVEEIDNGSRRLG